MKGLCLVFAFVLVNLLFSHLPLNSLYKYFQLFQAFSLYWILTNWPNQKRVLVVVKKAMLVGLGLMCLLVIWQFFKNSSVGGLWYFLGERSFSVTTPGISTFTFWGQEHVRPYAFFSHPNSLAGYLGASLLVLPMPAILWVLVVVVILMTNSWNTIFAMAICFVFVLKRPLPWRMARRGLKDSLVFAFLSLNFLFYAISWVRAPDVLVSAQRGLEGRMFLTREVLSQTVSLLPFGLGAGNEVLTTAQSNFFWTPQPVHNLLLILFVDFGLLVFVICFLLFEFVNKIGKYRDGVVLLMFVSLTAIADHYWWTLSQNLLLIPVLLYIITSSGKNKKH